MRYDFMKALGLSLAGIAGLVSAAGLVTGAGEAQANGSARRGTGNGAANGTVQPAGAMDHQSVLRIKESDGLPHTRAIRLARNKAMMIELPRDLRDVMVSSPDIMDAVVQSANRVHLIGKKVGQSNAFFYDANGEQILTLEVSIEQDTAVLDALLRRLIPGSSVKAEILNDTVILTGSVRNPIDSNRAADIASRFMVQPNPDNDQRSKMKVINMLAVEGEEQVMLRVTVAEVQRSLLKQMGVNLGAAINAGTFSTQLLTANALPLTAAAGLGGLPVPGVSAIKDADNACAGTTCFYNDGPTKDTFGNSGLTGGWGGNKFSINHAIRALERDGLIRTLAEPNLTTVSGEAAKFLAGGEYPIPMVDATGQVTVVYKEFGVGLAFTPQVLSEGRISLKIETEVSELSSQGAVQLANLSIPALKKRQAKSTVELPSGGSLALAGLLKEDVRQNIDGFPGLKDVPVLGTLFRSNDFIKSETELVVLVTPYMVKPVARQKLAKPDDGFAPASDLKFNFLGHLNRVYGKDIPPPHAGLKDGGVGFIID